MRRAAAGLRAGLILGTLAIGAVPAEAAPLLVDCNQNGISDNVDITNGTSTDCNGNTVPDECDTAISLTASTLESAVSTPKFPSAVDLDGDGDLDVVANANGAAWYENLDGPRRPAGRVPAGLAVRPSSPPSQLPHRQPPPAVVLLLCSSRVRPSTHSVRPSSELCT